MSKHGAGNVIEQKYFWIFIILLETLDCLFVNSFLQFIVKAHFVSTIIEVQVAQILSHCEEIDKKFYWKLVLGRMSKRAIKSTKNHQKRNNINNVRIIMVCEATVTPTPTLPPTIYHSRHSFQYKQILIIIVIIAVISRMKSNINTIMIIMSTMVLRHTYILIILDRIIIITVKILIILVKNHNHHNHQRSKVWLKVFS